MPKLEIFDDLLAPREEIVLRYSGSEPFKIYSAIPDLAETVLEIEAKDVWEDIFKWDITGGDMRWFYGVLTCEKKFDNWSKFVLKFRVVGEQHAKTKEGWAELVMSGWLVTSFNYSNFLQRAFWLLFSRTFYYETRRRYYNIARDYLFEMRRALMEALNLTPPVE